MTHRRLTPTVRDGHSSKHAKQPRESGYPPRVGEGRNDRCRLSGDHSRRSPVGWQNGTYSHESTCIRFVSGGDHVKPLTPKAAAEKRSALYRGHAEGRWKRIGRGIYVPADAPAADWDQLEAATRRPEPTICLVSALAHYDLTDAIPDALAVAIPRGTRAPATEGAIRWHRFGQPGGAVMLLLHALIEGGARLRYHGDFDSGGLAIARTLARSVPWDPWRFDRASYVSVASSKYPPIRGMIGDSPWDPELAASMTELGWKVEEEQVLDDLIADLAPRRHAGV